MKRLFFLFLTVLLVVAGSAAPAMAKDDDKPNAEACQSNGWQKLVDDDKQPFMNQGECMSYASQRGELRWLNDKDDKSGKDDDNDNDKDEKSGKKDDKEKNKAASELCDKDGWKGYTNADGEPFKNKGQCEKYARQGGELVEIVETSLRIVDGNEPWNGYLEGTGFTPGAKLTKVTFKSDRTTLNLTTPVGTIINEDGTFKSTRIIYWCSEYHGHGQTSGIVTAEDSAGVTFSQMFKMDTHCGPKQ